MAGGLAGHEERNDGRTTDRHEEASPTPFTARARCRNTRRAPRPPGLRLDADRDRAGARGHAPRRAEVAPGGPPAQDPRPAAGPAGAGPVTGGRADPARGGGMAPRPASGPLARG